jgi:hypothetical protein
MGKKRYKKKSPKEESGDEEVNDFKGDEEIDNTEDEMNESDEENTKKKNKKKAHEDKNKSKEGSDGESDDEELKKDNNKSREDTKKEKKKSKEEESDGESKKKLKEEGSNEESNEESKKDKNKSKIESIESNDEESKKDKKKPKIESDDEESKKEDGEGKKINLIGVKNLKIKNFDVSEMNSNEDGKQPIAYINYRMENGDKTNTKILIQTDFIKMVGGGIPSFHETYYPTDDKRELIKIPLDPDQPACVRLEKKLTEADDYFCSEKVKLKIFKTQKKADSFIYCPIVRTKVDNEDGEDKPKNKKKKESKYPPIEKFCKMKFNFVKIGDKRINKMKIIKNINNKKTKMKLTSLQELMDEITFLSTIRVIFCFNKIWINKTAAVPNSPKMYGVGLKIMAIEYIPSPQNKINPEKLEFMDDDDDENEKGHKESKHKSDNDEPKKNKNKDQKSKSDDDDEIPIKKQTKPKMKDEKSEDSLEDEEEEVKPIKKTKSHKK